MRKLIAYLTGGEPIVLLDHKDEFHYTIAYRHPFVEGKLYAHVYWSTKVGHVILNEDGTTYGNSNYIKKWVRG